MSPPSPPPSLPSSDAAALSSLHSSHLVLQSTNFSRNRLALGLLFVTLCTCIAASSPRTYLPFHTAISLLLTVLSIHRKHARRQLCYMLDFCWLANVSLTLWGALATTTALRPSPRILRVLAILACGPLGVPVVGLGNALVFHSIDHVIATFIHFSPNVVMWCLRWRVAPTAAPGVALALAEAVRPGFGADALRDACFFYAAWWVLYIVWMLADGLTRPARGYTTVYENFRPLSYKVGGWIGLEGMQCFWLYMVVHALLAVATMGFGALCWKFEAVHSAFLVASFVSACYFGAAFYEKHLMHFGKERIPEGRKVKVKQRVVASGRV